MKQAPKLISVFLLAAILPSCSKKPVTVSGQIFVVTKGRENIKMGGVDVRVIPDAEFQAMARTTASWMQEETRNEAQSRVDADCMTDFIKEVKAMEEAAPYPIPELERIRMAIVEESGTAERLMAEALSSNLLKRSFAKLLSQSSSTGLTSTDADGRFTVPIKGKAWFLAAAERAVGKESEEYLWVKSYEAPEGAESATMTISNDADIDSEDLLHAVLNHSIGASGGLESFRKVEVSEKMTKLVAKYREAAKEAKAKAEREAAEAKAKAEREAAEAKAKAKRKAAEAKAKLPSAVETGAIGKTLDVPLPGGSLLRMGYCPAGSFTMGSPASEEGRSGDENQVQVRISKAFWLGKTELTQAQWLAVMGDNPSSFTGNDLPVENVSWNDAQEFIAKVNAAAILPAGWKFALPTEAQWEYACRAGEPGPFSGGKIEEAAWYEGNSGSKTHEVGTKKANAWGLHDMHGNVWEWCSDWYDDTLAGGIDPKGPSSGVLRVRRGGSWIDFAAECRAAYRFRINPGHQGYYLGFRPALVPSE